MRLGNTIAEIRRRRGIKQKSLAQMCDVSPAYLSQIENDHREPALSVLQSISKHLSVPLPFLFFLATDETDVPPSKREAYSLLAPSVQSLIHALLDDGQLAAEQPS